MSIAVDQNEGANSPENLPIGTVLFHDQFEITGFVNSGGWGKAYLARNSLHQQVLLKECFPEAFCIRDGLKVLPRLERFEKLMNIAVNDFAREARQLATIQHPNVVSVHQVFAENNTAYIAMEFINGREMLELVDEKGPLSAKQAMPMTRKLLMAIDKVHEQKMLHRDISPDNILLRNGSDDPVLIDFGAARRHTSSESRALTALLVVKNGYSPQEFYVTGTEQSPASDIYSLGATMYFAVTGDVPPDAQSRLSSIVENGVDPCHELAGRVEGYPPEFLEGIDKAMQPRTADRFQSASEWLAYIDGSDNVLHIQTPQTAKTAPAAEPEPVPAPAVEAAPADVAPKASPAPAEPKAAVRRPVEEKAAALAAEDTKKSSKAPLLIAGAVGALAVGGYFALGTGGTPASAPATETTTQAAPAPASTETTTTAASSAPAATAATGEGATETASTAETTDAPAPAETQTADSTAVETSTGSTETAAVTTASDAETTATTDGETTATADAELPKNDVTAEMTPPPTPSLDAQASDTPPIVRDADAGQDSHPAIAANPELIAAPQDADAAPVGASQADAPTDASVAMIDDTPASRTPEATPDTAATETATAGGTAAPLQEQIVAEDWSIDLPYRLLPRLDGGRRVVTVRSVIGDGQSGTGLEEGMDILSANGSPVESPFDLLDAISFNGQHVTTLALQIRPENTPIASTRFVDFYQKGVVDFTNGARVSVSFADDGWQGVVTQLPEGVSALELGDVITSLTNPTWLNEAVAKAASAGETSVPVEVKRGALVIGLDFPLATEGN